MAEGAAQAFGMGRRNDAETDGCESRQGRPAAEAQEHWRPSHMVAARDRDVRRAAPARHQSEFGADAVPVDRPANLRRRQAGQAAYPPAGAYQPAAAPGPYWPLA